MSEAKELEARAERLKMLRAPFEAHQISKLPKETRAQIDARKANKSLMVWKCPECGGAHHKDAVHLDYVGHAALTDRLNETDPFWYWEPYADGPNGLPLFDNNGGLWIRLTVCGKTMTGYGDADGKQGGNAVKEAIGDALRNAGMRFGAALDLWHKGDLHGSEEAENDAPAEKQQQRQPEQTQEPEQDKAAIWTANFIAQVSATKSISELTALEVKEATWTAKLSKERGTLHLDCLNAITAQRDKLQIADANGPANY